MGPDITTPHTFRRWRFATSESIWHATSIGRMRWRSIATCRLPATAGSDLSGSHVFRPTRSSWLSEKGDLTMQSVMSRVSITCTLALCVVASAPAQQVHTLPGTEPLTWDGDLSERMMDGAHLFVERKIDESIVNRLQYWNRD